LAIRADFHAGSWTGSFSFKAKGLVDGCAKIRLIELASDSHHARWAYPKKCGDDRLGCK
jgi:hypothetical protein